MLRIASVCALMLIAAGAFAQRTEVEVRAVYTRMNALMAKNDAKGLVALFERTAAPDFVAIQGKQKIGRAQFAANLKKGLAVKNAPKGVSKVLSSKKVGKTLVLNIQWTVTGNGQNGAAFTAKVTTLNTWVQTPDGYRLQRIDEPRN